MTKEEIFAKLQTEVTIRGLSPGTYYTQTSHTQIWPSPNSIKPQHEKGIMQPLEFG